MRLCEDCKAVTSQQFHENELEKMRQNQTLSVPAKLQYHPSKGKMILIIERMSTESDITYMLSLDDQTRTKNIVHFDGWFGNSGGRPRARIVPGPCIQGRSFFIRSHWTLTRRKTLCIFTYPSNPYIGGREQCVLVAKRSSSYKLLHGNKRHI